MVIVTGTKVMMTGGRRMRGHSRDTRHTQTWASCPAQAPPSPPPSLSQAQALLSAICSGRPPPPPAPYPPRLSKKLASHYEFLFSNINQNMSIRTAEIFVQHPVQHLKSYFKAPQCTQAHWEWTDNHLVSVLSPRPPCSRCFCGLSMFCLHFSVSRSLRRASQWPRWVCPASWRPRAGGSCPPTTGWSSWITSRRRRFLADTPSLIKSSSWTRKL